MKPENVTQAALMIAELNRNKSAADKMDDRAGMQVRSDGLVKIRVEGLSGDYTVPAILVAGVFNEVAERLGNKLKELGVEL